MGLLSALLKWNELDPPSRAEKLRNDRICKLYQHNRNPFIDHPEYANLIWKNAILSTPVAYGSSPKAWINEFHYNNKGKDQNEVCVFLQVKNIMCLYALNMFEPVFKMNSLETYIMAHYS